MLTLIEMTTEVLAQQIAYDLYRPGFDLAFVSHLRKLYYAHHTQGRVSPSSAVVNLLQGIFEQYIDQSFFILRNRIYTTSLPQQRCLGMVKVAAKRISGEINPVDHGVEVAFEKIRVSTGQTLIESKYLSSENHWSLTTVASLYEGSRLKWARALANLNIRGEVLHDYNRDIACLLVDKSGELLSYGINANSMNKTLHAEINMVQKFFYEKGQKIPEGAEIITTRKPCPMCAGMIYDWCEKPESLKIYFAEEDKSSRRTVLDSVAEWIRLDYD